MATSSSVVAMFSSGLMGLTAYPLGLSCVVCLAVTALLVWRRVRSSEPTGRNPFSLDHVKPIRAVVTDKDVRKAGVKNKFNVDKIPEDIDDIVIGSGFGGLGVASLLSRAGHKVLVLEQHGSAGGCCHTFHERGFEFDTGIHYIGNMAVGSDDRTLIDQITGGGVEYPLMDEAFDTVCLGDPEHSRLYDILADAQKLEDSLIKRFPDEAEGIKKFMWYLKDSHGFMDGYFVMKFLPKWVIRLLTFTRLYNLMFSKYAKYVSITTKEILDRCTANQELRAVFSYIYGDYGVVPSKSSFGIHSVILNHYLGGAYYIRGGSSEVVLHTIPVIEGAGGRVLTKAPVSRILMDKGRAHGVEVTAKHCTVQIYAKRIISDAGLVNTFYKLLPREIATKSCIYPLIQTVGSSVSFLTAFIGLNGTKEELGLKSHNMWIYTRTDLEEVMGEYLNLSAEDIPDCDIPVLFASFPSAKDPTWEERFPGKSTCLLITLAKYEWFKYWKEKRVKRRGDTYTDLKNDLGQRMWSQLIKINPKLEGKAEFIEMGSPLSNTYYLGSTAGEIYGMEHSIERFVPPAAVDLRADTDIPGLYLTGQDILTCGFTGASFSAMLCASSILNRNLHGQDILTAGFTGASFSAMLCASSILNRNLHDDLTKLMKSMKKSA